MLFRKNEFTPYPVTDKVTFRNVDETLTLTVRADGGNIVRNLRKAQEQMQTLTEESTAEERLDAARMFATAIFGADQAQQIIDLYGDSLAVVSVCGDYFSDRLSKIVTKAQKRRGKVKKNG